MKVTTIDNTLSVLPQKFVLGNGKIAQYKKPITLKSKFKVVRSKLFYVHHFQNENITM